jgi:putative transposase
MIVAFVDELRAEGFAVESICRVLSEQGCQVAARTYRSWQAPSRVAAARTTDARGRRRLTPEWLYWRRKMTALLRPRMPKASPGSVGTDVRCWTGWVCVAFVVDVFAQRIVAWNAATSKDVDLVMT